MKARKNPTDEQLARRMRRPPGSPRDPRIKNDAYWALRHQGYPHSYAKRAFRDQLPIVHERQVSEDINGCDPDDLLISPDTKWTEVEVAIRPTLSDETIGVLQPRESEYTAWDHVVSGFGVRVRVTGHKSYVVYYRHRHGGKLRKHTIGKVGDSSFDQARQAARAFRTAARIDDEPRE